MMSRVLFLLAGAVLILGAGLGQSRFLCQCQRLVGRSHVVDFSEQDFQNGDGLLIYIIVFPCVDELVGKANGFLHGMCDGAYFAGFREIADGLSCQLESRDFDVHAGGNSVAEHPEFGADGKQGFVDFDAQLSFLGNFIPQKAADCQVCGEGCVSLVSGKAAVSLDVLDIALDFFRGAAVRCADIDNGFQGSRGYQSFLSSSLRTACSIMGSSISMAWAVASSGWSVMYFCTRASD